MTLRNSRDICPSPKPVCDAPPKLTGCGRGRQPPALGGYKVTSYNTLSAHPRHPFSPTTPPPQHTAHSRWGLTRTKIQGDFLRSDLRDVQVGLAGALAAQRDILHHADAAAGVFDGSGTTVRNQVLQEVAPRRDGLCAAELLGGEERTKGKGREKHQSHSRGFVLTCWYL